jgi:hypothetical protein
MENFKLCGFHQRPFNFHKPFFNVSKHRANAMLLRKGSRALMLHANRPIAFRQTNEIPASLLRAGREDLLHATMWRLLRCHEYELSGTLSTQISHSVHKIPCLQRNILFLLSAAR